jgi:hypothetical protein
MPDNDTTDMNEIGATMRNFAENFEELSNQEVDSYDDLIGKIILIEKLHKYHSKGENKKISEIERELENFLNSDD